MTVIGLGPMGQAMVNAFLDQGHPVTVWNRTASKADALVARGATRAATVAEALAANELVVLSLTDYDAMYAILEPAADALAGRVLVNLTSDTPDRARAAAAWAAEHGAEYLTGGVRVPPPMIGTPESSTFYSGPLAVFEAHQDTLKALTGTDYRGADPGLAALYYQLQMDLFWTTMTAFLHAVTVAAAYGISATELLPYTTSTMTDMPYFIDFYSKRIDNGEHPGDVDKLAMGAASIDHVVHTAEAAGVDASLPAAVAAIFHRGMAVGHADDSFTSLVEVIRNPAA